MLSPMVAYLDIPITLCRRVEGHSFFFFFESHSYFADKGTKAELSDRTKLTRV